MTITSTTAKSGPYNGNDVTVAFDYDFLILDEDDIVVTLTSAAGADVVKTIATHYTVSGVGNTSGGSVTMLTAPATGEKLTLTRATELSQGLDLQNRGAVVPQLIEDALDKITLALQDQSELLDRSVKIGVTADVTDLDALVSSIEALGALEEELTALGAITDDITTVADDGADIGTVAGLSSQITTLAPLSSQITTLAGISADITTVAGDAVDIAEVASLSSDIQTLAAGTGGTVSGTWNFSGTLQLGGTSITSTAAELNKLDGVTATAAQLNSVASGYVWGGLSFLETGTAATYTTPAGARMLKVTCVGAGGGGGGVDGQGVGTFACSGGGGGGGFVTAWIVNPEATYTYTIGAGGAGGAAGNNNGTAGGDSTWEGSGGKILNGDGGSGGTGALGSSGSNYTASAAGGLGTSTGFTTFLRGQGVRGAGAGDLAGDRTGLSHSGYCPLFGGGGDPANSGTNGANGARVGEGGTGTSVWDSADNFAGGNGADGVIIVEVYY